MIIEIKGSIFNSRCIAITNTVNCVGVMGKGLALAFKKIYYDNYLAYLDECKSKKIIPGKVFIYTNFRYQNHRYIINFPTKNHWKNDSKLEYISYLRGDEGRIINLPKENVNYDKVHLISTSEIIKTDLYVVCNSQTNLILHRLNNEMTAITPPCEIFKLK